LSPVAARTRIKRMTVPLIWRTSKRSFDLTELVLVMGILNVTPDSFSDGGRFLTVDDALRQAESMIDQGVDIIDIGGESTRPGSSRVAVEDEIGRVVPAIEAIAKRFDIAISVDTSKSEVARAAIDAGAEIVNDISGLRFDERIASVAAESKAGLVLMHSLGEFERMHSQPPAADIMTDVAADFRRSTAAAFSYGVEPARTALDIGIGFGKTLDQNLELLGKLDKLATEFAGFPMLVGISRKSFIGKILDGAPPDKRLSGSLAAATIAIWNGAKIVRVHDVRETVQTLKIVSAIRDHRKKL
jgi:dihydropteroate synthase